MILLIIVACIVLVALLGGAYCLLRIKWQIAPLLLIVAAIFYGIYAYLAITGYPAAPTELLYLWSTIVVFAILVLALFIISTPILHTAPGNTAAASAAYMLLMISIAAFGIFMFGITQVTGFLIYVILFVLVQLCIFHILAFGFGLRPFGFPVCVLGARAYPTFLLYPALLALLALPLTCTNALATFLLVSGSLFVTAIVVVWAYRIAVHWCCKLYRPSAIICCGKHHTPKGHKCHANNCLNYTPSSKNRRRH